MVVKQGGGGMCEFVVCLRGSVVIVNVLVIFSHPFLLNTLTTYNTMTTS